MKLGRILLVVGLMLAFLVGASGPAMAKVYTIKVSLHIPPKLAVPSYAAMVYFKNQVEAKAQGRIKVQLFPANQLGSERESLEGLKMGTHQMDLTSSGAVPAFWPPIQCLAMPYLFNNRAEAWHVFDGPFGRELVETMAQKTGLRILGLCENGIRHFVTSKKQIKSAADLKGLKIRTMENPAHMRLVKALGASPTPIAWGELYTAMQQGVVDGYELPLPLIDLVKLYQVSKYVILDGHIYDPAFIWINERYYQKLPADLKQIITSAAREANTIERAKNAFYDEVLGTDSLKKNGMIIYSPTAEQVAEFRAITQPAVKKFIKEQIGEEWTNKLNAAIAQARKDLAE